MTSPIESIQPGAIDFENLYSTGEIAEGLQFERMPWDIGEPQPAVIEFERSGRISGQVLDVGCGLGNNAIFLARKGYQVTGLDAAPTALEQARQRAAAQGVQVDFAVADATTLTGYEGRFDTVLDSALYHCLDPAQQRRYAAALHRATRPGARLNLLCFADTGSLRLPAALPVSADSVRETLTGAGWSVQDIRLGGYTAAAMPAPLVALLAEQGLRTETDDDGHLRLPVWIVTADRA